VRDVKRTEQQMRELSAGEFSKLRDWTREQDWKTWVAQVDRLRVAKSHRGL
jgi:hypothetical protein